jgi:Zn-dependent protease
MRLRFRIGSVPVRVDPSFLVMTVLFNVGLAQRDVRLLVMWGAIVFGSVLAHELGHAAVGLAFGLRPEIDLHALGGTTSWTAGRGHPVSWAKRIAISLAGPLAGMVTGTVVLALGALRVFPQLTWPTLPSVGDALFLRVDAATLGECAFLWLLSVNFGWGFLNLLPMLPLDGGNAVMNALHWATGGHGERPARVLSMVVALLAAAISALAGQWWPAILSAWFLSMNWRGLAELRERERLAAEEAGPRGDHAG